MANSSKNPLFKVHLDTGVPNQGYIYVEGRSADATEAFVQTLIHNLELTGSDDRILFDKVSDLHILKIEQLPDEEAEKCRDDQFVASLDEEAEGDIILTGTD